MHTHNLDHWTHDHTFGQDVKKGGETATLIVIAITAVMMVAEIAGGIIFGSMALLADGIHMGSHTAALGIAAGAYIYARRFAGDSRYSFGTGKVNALAGFGSAILLMGFAGTMAFESFERTLNPVPSAFTQALGVAVVGFIVNIGSAVILARSGQDHHHHHGDDDDHHHHHHHHGHSHDDDHNLKAAYLHVLADALTSITAIVALLAGKFFGWGVLDPVMGIVGSLVVLHWSLGLIASTSKVLLDRQAEPDDIEALKAAIEGGGDDRVTDIHLWSIGPGQKAAEIVVVGHGDPDPGRYKARIPERFGIAHATVEVHTCPGGGMDPTNT